MREYVIISSTHTYNFTFIDAIRMDCKYLQTLIILALTISQTTATKLSEFVCVINCILA